MTNTTSLRSQKVIARCRELAQLTDVEGEITRTFLSPSMRACMESVQSWMEAMAMSVTVDAAGNLRGIYPGKQANAPRLLIGSHLDTVPNAGAFDGVLGVMLGLALIEALEGQRLSFAIEIVGFSEEEGVRFHLPFIGSRALAGRIDQAVLSAQDSGGISVGQAMQSFGLDPEKLQDAVLDKKIIAYLEFHIEQGMVLESRDLSLGVVEAIAGQTRGEVTFAGTANHAGTTPMHLRRDAMCAAAQWICEVERVAVSMKDLVATVGRLDAQPGAGNVIAGEVRATLDVRHAEDAVRRSAVDRLVAQASSIAMDRGLTANWTIQMEQNAVWMDARLSRTAAEAIRKIGTEPLRMVSGAGHDAMVVASLVPSAMIFLRSPGGISHNPRESVRVRDVENALAAGSAFLRDLEGMLIGMEEKATHA